jgi:hypothetical protein
MKLDPFKNRSRLNSGSKAKYEAGGVGNTSYNNEDGCGKDHVQYANTEGYAPFVSNYNADIQTFFTGEIETKVSGFDLRLDFVAPQITPAHYVYTPCKGDGYTEDYNDEIYFMFSSYNDVLKLLFKDNSSLTGGSMKGNAGVAKNIHFNVWDVPANIVDATLTWGEIPAKYPNGTVIE